MNFTEYLYPVNDIENELTLAKASLLENTGNSDFIGNALTNIAKDLAKKPLHYRNYGMYWWALKDVLKRAEFLYGDVTDDNCKSVYIGKNDEQTIVMAIRFRREKLAVEFITNNQWEVNSEGEVYTLFDADMEGLAN